MNFRRGVVVAIFSVALAFALVGSLAFADEFDQSMKLTFAQPVAIPGQVLPAGTYWFVRPGHGSQPNVLQVFDSSRKTVLATVSTGTDQVVKPSGHIIITMADRSPKPLSLLSLVYPGTQEGHAFELEYPAQERRQLSEFPKVTMRVSEKGDMEKMETNAGM